MAGDPSDIRDEEYFSASVMAMHNCADSKL